MPQVEPNRPCTRNVTMPGPVKSTKPVISKLPGLPGVSLKLGLRVRAPPRSVISASHSSALRFPSGPAQMTRKSLDAGAGVYFQQVATIVMVVVPICPKSAHTQAPGAGPLHRCRCRAEQRSLAVAAVVGEADLDLDLLPASGRYRSAYTGARVRADVCLEGGPVGGEPLPLVGEAVGQAVRVDDVTGRGGQGAPH